MVVKETERDRLREGRINGRVGERERWIERMRECKEWERQIDKGEEREKNQSCGKNMPPGGQSS